uniref:DEK_C domain-containing protein n=1 Tax=Steinernema glaseri TaxID=37863 RepID=A0A1I8AK80_9BILA
MNDFVIARTAIHTVRTSNDYGHMKVATALGDLHYTHLSPEEEKQLQLEEFLDELVEKEVLKRCYASMILLSVRKPKEEAPKKTKKRKSEGDDVEGSKTAKKAKTLSVKKASMKTSVKAPKKNYICVPSRKTEGAVPSVLQSVAKE